MAESSNHPVVETIRGLTREEALEAALALGDLLAVGGDPADAPEAAHAFVAELHENPFAGVADVEDLARSALLIAALDPMHSTAVEEVLARVGEKAFIFGGAEIVAAGIVAVKLIEVIMKRGRKSTEETTEIITAPDGSSRLIHRKKTVYEPSEKVGGLMASLVDADGPG